MCTAFTYFSEELHFMALGKLNHYTTRFTFGFACCSNVDHPKLKYMFITVTFFFCMSVELPHWQISVLIVGNWMRFWYANYL
jgi:hypothetical protein